MTGSTKLVLAERAFPDEDLDERDHCYRRCGADRPAIIQTGAEIVPLWIARGETIQVREQLARTQNRSPRVAASAQ